MTALTALADAPWLTGERVRRFALLFAGVALIVLALNSWLHTRAGVTSIGGAYLGADFVNFWGGAHLAAAGHALGVYDIQGFIAWQRAHSAANAEFKWYSYPPTTLLLSLPLAVFGFKTGLVAWLVAGWSICFLLLKRMLPWRIAALAAFATPAAFLNAMSGQNGQFSAALLCGGILFLESNPILAGLLFGLLCFKPHLAILVPIALAAGGYWRAFAAALVSAIFIVGVSFLSFGSQTWMAFLHNAPFNTWLMEHGSVLWHRMPTVFSMVRLAGGPILFAYGLQLVSALAAILFVIRTWQGDARVGRKGAVLVLATFLATPYAWDYDLVSLTFALAWLVLEGIAFGFRPWEKFVLALTIAMPLLSSFLDAIIHVQIGPLVLWPALMLAMRKRQEPIRAA